MRREVVGMVIMMGGGGGGGGNEPVGVLGNLADLGALVVDQVDQLRHGLRKVHHRSRTTGPQTDVGIETHAQ